MKEFDEFAAVRKAQAEMKRRALVFDEVWEFIESFDTDGGYGGITEYDAGHAGGYQMAAEGIIDKIREIMTREHT